MGTRGLFGFYYKGKYYIAYNHYDSYPSGLGVSIIKQIKAAIKAGKLDEWKGKLLVIKVVSDEVKPTREDIKNLEKYTSLEVSNRSTDDWYCLLRGCQGSLNAIVECGYIFNYVDKDGKPDFFCDAEYTYILNFDTEKLDFYVYDELKDSFDLDKLPDWSEEEN